MMTETNSIEKIKEEAKSMFASAKGCHDWDHTERVYQLAKHLAEKEGADMEIVELAAILHDIGREEQDNAGGKVCHAEIGAEIAAKILKKHGYDDKKTEKITHCVRCHRFRGENIPNTKEAQVIYDADKLDAIGAIGLGRAFVFSGEVGARVHFKDIDVENTKEYSRDDTCYREFLVKLKHVKDKMLTPEGKRIAEGRHQYMVEFFDRLNREVDGEL
ncbi:TPA: HD domain-containing protein [Candidatus Woesearchaeota archaeon]|nr:HD domain-containing protein [Candidatus Woesearchaeota archaeon]